MAKIQFVTIHGEYEIFFLFKWVKSIFSMVNSIFSMGFSSFVEPPHWLHRSARAVSDRPPRTRQILGGGPGVGGSAAAAKVGGGDRAGMQQMLGLKGRLWATMDMNRI
jgi:hypothetical protein